jgi:hypothetical protein
MNTKPTVTYIVLYDGYTVSADFYDKIRYQVEEILDVLDPNEINTLERLCGDEFWQSFTAGEKKMAGRCMANMVVTHQLPFRFVQGEHEYPKLYQLINDDDS